MDTESYGGGIRVLAPYLIVWGYVGIYRRKKYVGGPSRGPRDGGRPTGGPISWDPRKFLYLHSKLSGSCSFQKSRSQRCHSVWTPFDIPFLRNTEIGKKTTIWVGPPVNRLVPKINIKVLNKAHKHPK